MCCRAVIDAFSRRVTGWSIADRAATELVTDALERPAGNADPNQGTSFTPFVERNTRVGFSATGYVKQDSLARRDGSPPASTTR